MTPLPSTWIATTLGAVVPYGTTVKAEPEEIAPGTWVLELEDIEKDSSKVLQRLTIEERQSKSTKNRFDAGDVLYGKLRPYLNKVTFADTAGVCTTEIVPIKPNEAVNGRYLFHWLRHPSFLTYVTEVSHGVNMPRLGTEAGRQAPFVLAPLAEQKRIADTLDTVLTRVDAVNTRLARVAPILKRFRQSVLAAATSGRLTEDWRGARDSSNPEPNTTTPPPELPDLLLPAGWEWVPIGALAAKVTDGVHKKPAYQGSGIPFLTVGNLTSGPGIDYQNTRFISEADHREFCKRTNPEKGDILITKDGTLGVVRLIDSDRPFSIFVSLALVKLKDKAIAPYVTLALQSPHLQVQMKGVGTGLQHIHLTDLRKDLVPLPTGGEQTEIVRRVETLFAFADRLEARLQAAQTAADRLTPALLAKAFRGELVPQDPNDEPASELLRRLQASTPAAAPRRRARSAA